MPSGLRVSAWIAVFVLLAPSAGGAQERTEREIINLIVRDGPTAQAIGAEVEVTRREQLARLAYPNPGVLYSREGAGFTEFLQVEQSFPLFGVRAALSRAGVAATAAAEAERDARLWALRSDAAAAVARLLAGEARVAAGQAHAREVERLLEILRAREREGEGSRFDRVRAEQEIRDVRQALAAAAVDVAEARAALAAMLPRGVQVTAVTSARDPLSAHPADTLATRGAGARAELRALRQAAARAEIESDAARRARRPSPAFFGGLKRADTSRRESGGIFGLSVSVPVFDGGGREAARWTAERARIDAERAAIEQRILTEVSGASAALVIRQAALREDAEGSGDELVKIAEVAYREGEAGILELLDAFRTASRARLRTVDLRLAARLAQIALERAVGDVLWP